MLEAALSIRGITGWTSKDDGGKHTSRHLQTLLRKNDWVDTDGYLKDPPEASVEQDGGFLGWLGSLLARN